MTTSISVPPTVEAARAAFENAQGMITPQALALLVPGASAILRLPPPWTEADLKIVRCVDTAYGGRDLWVRGTQDWADRVEASDEDRRRIAELEVDIAVRLDAMLLRREEYVNVDREIRRRQHLFAKAPLDHERGRIVLPPGEDLSIEAFERLDRDLKRGERVYVTALEAYQDAKGALSEYKQKVQDRWTAREVCRSQRAAREEQERRGVRWADR